MPDPTHFASDDITPDDPDEDADELQADFVVARLLWANTPPAQRKQRLELGPLDPSVYGSEDGSLIAYRPPVEPEEPQGTAALPPSAAESPTLAAPETPEAPPEPVSGMPNDNDSDELASDLVFARLSWTAATPKERAQMLALGPLDPAVYGPDAKALKDLDSNRAEPAPSRAGRKKVRAKTDENKKPHVTLIGKDATKADLDKLAADLRAQAASEKQGR